MGLVSGMKMGLAMLLAGLIQIRSGKLTRINATGRMTLAELK